MRTKHHPPRPQHPRHLPAALASAGLVLALHGWLLAGMPRLPGPWRGDPAAAARAVQVRQIVVAPAAAATALPATSPRPLQQTPASPLPRQHGPASTANAAVPGAAPPDRQDQTVQPDRPVVQSDQAARQAGPDQRDQPDQQARPDQPDQPDPPERQPAVPVYATRLPPPATLHYSLRRGAAGGRAVLHWAPDAGRYALTLHGPLLAAPNIARTSLGAIDAHGIAPERYTESRRGRELRAANFQRDSARITFSGPRHEHPLPPGAQDRLSWMLQLGAVMAADPSLAAPGREVLLFVAGARGDAEVWTFVVQGTDHIELPGAGSTHTLLLRREPRRSYDTLVQVWLDPARHHLPVRADLSIRAETTELVLEALTLP